MSRPRERKKDAQDLCFLMREYYDLETRLVYNSHGDLFDAPDFDKNIASARIYGREVSQLAYGVSTLESLCLNILREQTSDSANSLLARHMGRRCIPQYDPRFQMLNGFRHGVQDRLGRKPPS